MKYRLLIVCATAIFITFISVSSFARTLDQIREEGVLRHIGVPYANFITGQGDGLSIELIKRFADHLGVRYEFVESSWTNVVSDLTGYRYKINGDNIALDSKVPVRGDLIANGLTIVPWRQKVIDFSHPTFPTQVWLVTTSDFPLKPITPKSEKEDIIATRELLKNITLLGKKNTCLDPRLYPFKEDDFTYIYIDGALNDLFPAILQGEADCTLLDVPDALLAIGRWIGQVKVLGPLSEKQSMGVGFRKDNPELRHAFNEFYTDLRLSGEFCALVKKYYPEVIDYFPDFFETKAPCN